MTDDDSDLEHLLYSDPSNVDADNPRPYHDPENLRELYHERGWSQREIADFYDVSQPTISRAMEKAEIESRPPMDERKRRGVYRNQRPNGRAQFVVEDYGEHASDETVRFYESNLVALHNAPLELVLHDEMDVDHDLNSPLHINLPENLTVLPSDSHQASHVGTGEIPHETLFERLGDPVDEEADSRQTVFVPTAQASGDKEPAGEPREGE